MTGSSTEDTEHGEDQVLGVVLDPAKSADIEWDEDFEPADRQYFDWPVIAAQLRSRPGRWASVPGCSPSFSAMVKSRRAVAFREGRWQSATRRGVLYLRYLGPEDPQLPPGRS